MQSLHGYEAITVLTPINRTISDCGVLEAFFDDSCGHQG